MNKITYLCFVVFFVMLNICEAQIQRVRIDFVSPDKYTRHLLLSFTPDNSATDGFDYGYDGPNPDDFLNDLNWIIEEKRYIIQGVGAFNETKQYPFGMFLSDSGDIEIILTGLENFDSEIDVFIYDLLLDTYTKINEGSFKMNLNADDYIDRFYIAFKQEEVLVDEEITDDDMEAETGDDLAQSIINYLTSTDEIYAHIPDTEFVKQVYLINLLGQTVTSWSATDINFSNEFKIPVKNISGGTYIIIVETNVNFINKKIIIKN